MSWAPEDVAKTKQKTNPTLYRIFANLYLHEFASFESEVGASLTDLPGKKTSFVPVHMDGLDFMKNIARNFKAVLSVPPRFCSILS